MLRLLLLQRISVITKALEGRLQFAFRHGLDTSSQDTLRQCLHIYALIDKAHDAEALYKDLVVRPFFVKLLQRTATAPSNLETIYASILNFSVGA